MHRCHARLCIAEMTSGTGHGDVNDDCPYFPLEVEIGIGYTMRETLVYCCFCDECVRCLLLVLRIYSVMDNSRSHERLSEEIHQGGTDLSSSLNTAQIEPDQAEAVSAH